MNKVPLSILKVFLLITTILQLTINLATAHDYWLEKEGEDYLLYNGHYVSQHKGDAIVPYDPSIIKQINCANQTGEILHTEFSRTYPIRIHGPCACILIEAETGIWSKSLAGITNQSQEEIASSLRSWQSIEGLKWLEVWSESLSQPISPGLELVSTNDPFKLKPGDKVRLLVTWREKPRPGVTVAYGGDPRGVTDKDGRINIRIRHGGIQVITASMDEPSVDGTSDKTVHSTSLIFILPN